MVIKVGEVYPSNNCGDMEVIEYVNSSKVRVRFIDTGFEKTTRAYTIRKGEIKDVLMPSIRGVGYVGEGTYKSSAKGKPTKEYQTWMDMIIRCYDAKHHIKNPTYTGCTIVRAWHNFQVFAKWFNEHYIEGYHLDKDIKVPGNKVYGPDTCTFVPASANIEKARAVTVMLRSPKGERVEVYNISKFARENGLDQGALSKVKNGKAKHHKGWTLYKD